MNTWDTQYRSKGLRQLEALHTDIKPVNPAPGAPKDFTARQSTALDWIAKYASRYDVVIDPTYQLNRGVKPSFDPRGWLIDTKTMKIVKTYTGAPGFLQGLDTLLK